MYDYLHVHVCFKLSDEFFHKTTPLRYEVYVRYHYTYTCMYVSSSYSCIVTAYNIHLYGDIYSRIIIV